MSNNSGEDLFGHNRYLIRRKFLKIFGASFHVFAGEQLLGYSEQKAFKLKEDIRVFRDESKQQEILSVQARQIIDFSAAYDILDPVQGIKVGAARRKGFRSMMRDSWELLDEHDQPLSQLQEDSTFLALVRRFVLNIIPQTFQMPVPGSSQPVIFRQHFNPFIYKLDVEIPESCTIDRRLVFGIAVLICAVEGQQK